MTLRVVTYCAIALLACTEGHRSLESAASGDGSAEGDASEPPDSSQPERDGALPDDAVVRPARRDASSGCEGRAACADSGDPPGSSDPPLAIDELITRCPSAQTLAEIDADLDIRFEYGPQINGDEVVCTAADSGRDLTHLQERVYQALIAMRALEFDRPLPWTDLGLYDWLVQQVRGIRLRDDIGVSHCCPPPADGVGPYVNIQVGPGASVLATDLWASVGGGLYTLVSLITHEARHVASLHSCGNEDNTISELGAFGVEYYLYTYLAYHSDPCFLRPTLPASSEIPQQLFGDDHYLVLMRDEARYRHAHRFCAEPSWPLPEPTDVRTCEQSCVPAVERCNLVDDDCDLTIDEDTEGTACGIDQGECTTGTVTACELGLERCTGQQPVTETCGDALDNDCDGQSDEGGCGACADTSGETLDGSLVVRTAVDLAQLEGVTCITGTLHILATSLADLTGFARLEAVGGDFWITGNSALQDLTGLGALRRAGRIFIRDNPELLTLRGLEDLASIDTYHLLIDGNAKLENLDGLGSLTTIADQLGISENPVLTDISGLSALTQVGGGVYIHDNPMLPACQADAIASSLGKTCNSCAGNDETATCN